MAELSQDHAVVEWTVSSISYTPEVYYIRYGLSPESLTAVSNTTEGTSDISATNLLFSLSLTGLRFQRTYFYQVVAENSVGTTESSVANFTTSSPGNSMIYVS